MTEGTTTSLRREWKMEAIDHFWNAQLAVENEIDMAPIDPLTRYGVITPHEFNHLATYWIEGDTRQKLLNMKAKTRAVVMLRHQELTLDAIAAILKMTRERVRQIYEEGLYKLRHPNPKIDHPRPSPGMGEMKYLPLPRFKPSRNGITTVVSKDRTKVKKPRQQARETQKQREEEYHQPQYLPKPKPRVFLQPDGSLCCIEKIAVRIVNRARALGLIRIATGRWAAGSPTTRISTIEFLVLPPTFNQTERRFQVKVRLWRK